MTGWIYGATSATSRPGRCRDTAPDVLAPIDADAPGQRPRSGARDARLGHRDAGARLDAPRPPSSSRPSGRRARTARCSSEIDPEALAAEANRSHAQPLVDEGPCDLPVVYALDAGAFDVIVNADHLLSWGVEPDRHPGRRDGQPRAWSAGAAWTDEVSGERRLLSSDTGDGWDAARILLPEVREQLDRRARPVGRVLVGLPERDLLVAGTLRPGDDEFAALFADVRRRALAAAPTSRSTGGSSSSSTAGSSSSRTPQRRPDGPTSASRSTTRSPRSRSTGRTP